MLKEFLFNLLNIEEVIPKGVGYILFEDGGYINMSHPSKYGNLKVCNLTATLTEEAILITQSKG